MAQDSPSLGHESARFYGPRARSVFSAQIPSTPTTPVTLVSSRPSSPLPPPPPPLQLPPAAPAPSPYPPPPSPPHPPPPPPPPHAPRRPATRPATRPTTRPTTTLADARTTFGLPIATLVATCISIFLNGVTIILLLTLDCPWNKNQVWHFFAFVVVAELALIVVLFANLAFRHRHHSGLNMTLSFIYAGSAALLIYALINALFVGLCAPKNTPAGSIMISKYPANYVIWFMTVASAGLQTATFYYYD